MLKRQIFAGNNILQFSALPPSYLEKASILELFGYGSAPMKIIPMVITKDQTTDPGI